MNTLRENRGVKDENMGAVEGEKGDGVEHFHFSSFFVPSLTKYQLVTGGAELRNEGSKL